MPPPTIATLSLLLLLFPLQSSAQSTRSGSGDDVSYSSNFTPAMAILVAILISSTFLAGILYIYIRKCTDASRGTVWATQRVPRAVAARGLEASAIAAFPTMVYSEVKGSRIGKGALECAICLNEFEEDETLRLIPKCDHVFHPDCIDAWLGSHTTCPVCRADLVAQPGVSVAKQPEFARPDSDLEAQIETELPAEANSDSWGRRFLWSRSMERPVQIRAGESSERFTLRLSSEMRSKIMERSKSMILATERSSPRGFRGDGVKLEQSSFRRFSSFLLRMPSIKSAKVAASSGGDGEGTSSTQV